MCLKRGWGGGSSEPPEPPLKPPLKFVTQDHPTWESINDTVTMQTVQYCSFIIVRDHSLFNCRGGGGGGS